MELKQKRNSSVELLRIIAMLFIVISHYSVHGGIDIKALDFSFNKILLQISTLGNLGVIIFMMISGYFMCQNKFKFKKVIKLILQILFYSLGIYIILNILGLIPFSISSLVKATFPVLFKEYWFATAYVVIFILSPFINKVINNITRRELLIFICTLLFIWSIIPTFTTCDMYGNVVCQFLLFYLLGAYIRKYPDNILSKNKYKVAIISSVLLILSTLSLNLVALKYPMFNYGSFFFSRYSILTILLGISLLSIFVDLEINNKYINKIATCTFGIYLIHDNNYMRGIIWPDIFHNPDFAASPYLIIHLIITVLIVFIVCGIIDYLRQIIIEKPIMKCIDKYWDKFEQRIVNLIKKIYKKFKIEY